MSSQDQLPPPRPSIFVLAILKLGIVVLTLVTVDSYIFQQSELATRFPLVAHCCCDYRFTLCSHSVVCDLF